MAETAAHLIDDVLPRVPIRPCVLSLPSAAGICWPTTPSSAQRCGASSCACSSQACARSARTRGMRAGKCVSVCGENVLTERETTVGRPSRTRCATLAGARGKPPLPGLRASTPGTDTNSTRGEMPAKAGPRHPPFKAARDSRARNSYATVEKDFVLKAVGLPDGRAASKRRYWIHPPSTCATSTSTSLPPVSRACSVTFPSH